MRTLFVTLGCVLGAVIGCVLLYEDINSVGVGGRGTVMAQVERKEARVRRKPASTYVWGAVQPQEALYRHDSIQTGEVSAATIRYKDGSTVELGENSLVVIDDLSNLSLNFGSLLVKGSNGKDTEITVGRDGKAQSRTLSARLVEPAPHAQYFLGSTAFTAVRFSWKLLAPLASGDQLFLEISDHPKFDQPDKIKRTEITTKADLKQDLTPAQYFWRLSNSHGPLTPAAPFVVAAVEPLKPLWPNPSEKVVNFGESSIQFRWETPNKLGVGEHSIEVAQDSSFNQVLFHETVEAATGRATLKHPLNGNYFWRTVSRYDGGISVVSRAERFTVEKGQRVSIELLKPEKESVFSLHDDVRFNWTASADVAYEWEFEHGAGQSTQIKSDGNALSLKSQKFGTKSLLGAHRWRVKAISPQGQVLGESEWRPIAFFEGAPVELQSPAPEAKIFYWKAPGDLQLKWKSDRAKGETFKVQVASDPEFKHVIVTQSTSSESISGKDLSLTDGKYFWRVQQMSPSGEIVKSSSSQGFTYGIVPPLTTSVLISPEDFKIYSLLESDLDTILSWQKVEGAKEYEVSIYPHSSGVSRAIASDAKPITQQVVRENRLRVQKLPVGEYEWTVRAIDSIDRRGQIPEPRIFKVIYGETLTAPESLTPEVQ